MTLLLPTVHVEEECTETITVSSRGIAVSLFLPPPLKPNIRASYSDNYFARSRQSTEPPVNARQAEFALNRKAHSLTEVSVEFGKARRKSNLGGLRCRRSVFEWN